MRKERNYRYDKRKDKPKSREKRVCYNCEKYGYFIVNCPHKKKEEDDGKKKKEKYFIKYKKFSKKKYTSEAHLVIEWDPYEESSDLDDEGVATFAIKETSSSKSLFANLNMTKSTTHACLMAKEGKRKIKTKSNIPYKYVSSDEEINNDSEDEPLKCYN